MLGRPCSSLLQCWEQIFSKIVSLYMRVIISTTVSGFLSTVLINCCIHNTGASTTCEGLTHLPGSSPLGDIPSPLQLYTAPITSHFPLNHPLEPGIRVVYTWFSFCTTYLHFFLSLKRDVLYPVFLAFPSDSSYWPRKVCMPLLRFWLARFLATCQCNQTTFSP
jgi:hypothetical protein